MSGGPVGVKFSPLDDEVKLAWDRTLRSMHMVGDLHSMTALGGPPVFERDLDESRSQATLERGPVALISIKVDGIPVTCERFSHAGLDFVFAADQVAVPLVLTAPAERTGEWPEFVSSLYDQRAPKP